MHPLTINEDSPTNSYNATLSPKPSFSPSFGNIFQQGPSKRKSDTQEREIEANIQSPESVIGTIHWHESHDNLLKAWRKQASINLWLQIASNYYYGRLNDFLSYPAIIIAAVTSIGVFGIDNTLLGKYITSILALMTGTLTAVNKHLQAAEKAKEFMLCAKDYYMFIREIDYILATVKDERPNIIETMNRIRATYDRIVDMQLDPPIHIIKRYERKFRPLEEALFQDLQSEKLLRQTPLATIRDIIPQAPTSENPTSSKGEGTNINNQASLTRINYFSVVKPLPAKHSSDLMSQYNIPIHDKSYIQKMLFPLQRTGTMFTPILSQQIAKKRSNQSIDIMRESDNGTNPALVITRQTQMDRQESQILGFESINATRYSKDNPQRTSPNNRTKNSEIAIALETIPSPRFARKFSSIDIPPHMHYINKNNSVEENTKPQSPSSA